MKKLPAILVVVFAIAAASCSRKAPEFVNHIPDDAFVVASVHPANIFEKGQVSSLESIKKEIDNEFMLAIFDDPLKSGLMMDEYAYMFIYFKNDQPMIGFIAGLKDRGDFEKAIDELSDEAPELIKHDDATMLAEDGNENMMAWTGDKVLFLNSPELEMSMDDWKDEVTVLFNQPKEEAITSMVDFKDFMGNMKDLNVWFSSDELHTVMEKSGAMRDMEMELPVQLLNNYGHVYCEFTNEGVFINGETRLSEEMEKNTEFIVARPELNKSLIENTPGGNLIMAMAFSLDIENFRELASKVAPPETNEMGSQIEEMTGVTPEELWSTLTGDMVIAVNGVEDGGMMPLEVFIGIGVNDKMLQEKLMGTVGSMADVKQEEDFFMINTNGIEIYSGIVDGIWVITNAKGYKDAITGGGLEKTLADTRFNDFAGGAMGMYMNLDMTTYPAALQQMATQDEQMRMTLEAVSSAFTSLGMQASDSRSEIVLESASNDENSLYTLLRMAEKQAMN